MLFSASTKPASATCCQYQSITVVVEALLSDLLANSLSVVSNSKFS